MGKKTATNQLKQHRVEQLEKIQGIVGLLQERLAVAQQQREKLLLLDSVSKGLYDEVDKLSKKAPAEFITDLVLNSVNDVIKETKELISADSYVQRQNEFVAAGDNPQHRDAVVVLRQIRQGLERFESDLASRRHTINAYFREAQTINLALELFKDGERVAGTPNELETAGFENEAFGDFGDWFYGDHRFQSFNFEKLDQTDIGNYFSEALQ